MTYLLGLPNTVAARNGLLLVLWVWIWVINHDSISRLQVESTTSSTN